MNEFCDFDSSIRRICWRKYMILKKNKLFQLIMIISFSQSFKKTYFCSCSVAVISVILTKLLAHFNSADTFVHCKSPNKCASSEHFCACNI